MKKFIIGIILTIIGFVVLLAVTIGKCANGVQKEIDAPKEKVGKTYVVTGDTVVVMDYSFFHSTYKLSNGKEVAFAFLDSLKPIK